MVEVIYICKQGKYPFGRGKQNEHTYMQHLVQAQNEDQVIKYRQLNSIMRKISNPHIMRLEKVLKEGMTFHMIYQFHDKSLDQRLRELQKQQELADIFVELEIVFDTLIEQKLKAQLYLDFMGVDQKNHLKVWVKPDELDFLGNQGDSDSKIRKILVDYYETQRTRIHLEIQEIFQTSEVNILKKNPKKRESEKDKIVPNIQQANKTKTPNFVIEGNQLVFLNKQGQKVKVGQKQDSEQPNKAMNKANHMMYEQRPTSKAQNMQSNKSQLGSSTQCEANLSKMSVAQKVLYYKKQKQNQSQSNSHQNNIIVKDSSTNNVSQNDLSKSSNNDSNIQIKTEMINKHKMKIITSQEVQVQGDSDDDLQKLARQKIAKINKQRQQRSHQQINQNNSMEGSHKGNLSGNSENIERFLKALDENSRQQRDQGKHDEQSKQINSKIAQAKLKAKNILDKYSKKN